jgi:hypothetical protein
VPVEHHRVAIKRQSLGPIAGLNLAQRQMPADLRIQLFEDAIPAVNEAKPQAARVTVWERALGFHLRSAEQAGSGPGDIKLSIEIRRGGAFMLFAFAAYGAMVVLGCCALAIGLITFIDARRAEATLIGAIAAIAFALPVLRNALPGTPPLGVRADMFVFLWTELAAVIGLALVTLELRLGRREIYVCYGAVWRRRSCASRPRRRAQHAT